MRLLSIREVDAAYLASSLIVTAETRSRELPIQWLSTMPVIMANNSLRTLRVVAYRLPTLPVHNGVGLGNHDAIRFSFIFARGLITMTTRTQFICVRLTLFSGKIARELSRSMGIGLKTSSCFSLLVTGRCAGRSVLPTA